MTDLLAKAFRAASALPPEDQDALARAILAEVAGEAEWDKRFTQSADLLAQLADEALDEHRRGRTEPLDPDAL